MLACDNKMNPPLKTHRYVCAEGYLHDGEAGRIECPFCGRWALSRQQAAISLWEAAHGRFCKKRPQVPARA